MHAYCVCKDLGDNGGQLEGRERGSWAFSGSKWLPSVFASKKRHIILLMQFKLVFYRLEPPGPAYFTTLT